MKNYLIETKSSNVDLQMYRELLHNFLNIIILKTFAKLNTQFITYSEKIYYDSGLDYYDVCKKYP